MLKVRVIPTLLWKQLGLVKGVGFDSWRRIGTLLPAIKVYNTREVDELVLLDISATAENREPDYETIEGLSMECFVPLTVGGGIKNLDHVRRLLQSGADKVALNSTAYENPSLISEVAGRFGVQCVVASVDVRKTTGSRYECFSHCGTQKTGKDPVAWVRELEKLGAGEILLTSVECDGTMNGYDLELIRSVSESVRIPVIASGGAGTYEHLVQAITVGHASAVAASSMFHFTEQTPLEAKRVLKENGVRVRKY
ncbi:MAG: glycosyl amidation-associated protein WbuZ [Spirochaetia bacterium]|nr:glycosyl amidation-associated protein WbuZ [Spirochaetia bacterium]